MRLWIVEKAHTTKKVGVEHASMEPILEALNNVITYDEHPLSNITVQDLYDLGLTGQSNSKELRYKIGNIYHIGNGNAKTMCQRLNCLGITLEELKERINNE